MIGADTLDTTPRLNLIAELDEFKGAWQVHGTLAPERRSALRRVATFESIGSCGTRCLDLATPFSE